MQAQYVPEIDVLIAVIKWLHLNGWTLERLSMPHGQKIDSALNKNNLKAELSKLDIEEKSIRMVSKGEDIRARQGDNLWRIECKGLGSGKPKTVKSNFDRAVASTVSYYIQSDRLRLGLALPDDEYYLKLLRNKVPQALRVAINLWIFLYLARDEVLVYAPDEELPL